MPYIVLRTSRAEERYVIWSTSEDKPIEIYDNKRAIRAWYRRNGYSQDSIYNELCVVDQRGSSDEDFGLFSAGYLPVGEDLSPPDGWWRIRRSQLSKLADRALAGETVTSLLERYAD